jgi:2-dehydro-3-deoxyphosphogluconate aldolase / (4S)-4-hydroxy-2-oxoglutarate aldolase
MTDDAPGAQSAETLIARYRILPVVVLEDARSAAGLGAALVSGGLPLAEVTFRTEAAEAAIKEMSAEPRLLVGAGTVIEPGQVDRAVAAGARFIVSPGFSSLVVHRAQQLGVPVFPGVATPTEIMAALDAGLDTVKFFPAESLGGLGTIKALAGPFPGLRFIPTGGITEASMAGYLSHPAVIAVGGSWMVAPKLIRQGQFDEVSRLAAQALRNVPNPEPVTRQEVQ